MGYAQRLGRCPERVVGSTPAEDTIYKMFTVYILLSKNFSCTYVDFRKNLSQRIASHNNGKVKATKPYKPWTLIYGENLSSLTEVKSREKYWKSGAGRRNIKRILEWFPPNFRIGRGSLK